MAPTRLKITFPPNADADTMDLALESGFGGMGTAYRGETERVLYLSRFSWPFNVIEAQLNQSQRDGLFKWEIAI
jgi:hypothetical protein